LLAGVPRGSVVVAGRGRERMLRLTEITTATAALRRRLSALGAALLLLLAAPVIARAAEPQPWEMGFQPAATPITQHIHRFHNELLVIIFLISVFVLGLLLYVIVRFNARRHPVATRTSHNPLIEFLWTVVPVVILVVIAIPSFKLMYYMDRVPQADMTIKVTGHQWYWSYAYPDQGGFEFNSNLIPDEQLKPGQKRLLEVDNPLVVPVGTTVRVQVTGTDVIHSWFVPSFGVQEYAIVGRLNEAWINVLHEGTYYGECNQICGVNHAFMPIKVQVVSKEDFQTWAAEQKKNAGIEPGGGKVAANAAAPAAP
jgi:cytochrome c oxidase subunit 2